MERESSMRSPLPDGRTPIYRAAADGDEGRIRALASANANVDEPSSTGSTPVYIAAANGHARAISALKEAGVNVNTPNRNGTTPLYIAAFNGQVEAVHVLLDVGADASIMTRGETALTCTRRGQAPGHPIVVKLLEEHFEQHPNGVKPVEVMVEEVSCLSGENSPKRVTNADERNLRAIEITMASEPPDECVRFGNNRVNDADSEAPSMSIAGNKTFQELSQAKIKLELNIARMEQENKALRESAAAQTAQQANGLHQVNALSVRLAVVTRQFEAMREAKDVAESEAQEQTALRVAESITSAEREAANKLEVERLNQTLTITNQTLAVTQAAAQAGEAARIRLAAIMEEIRRFNLSRRLR